MTSPTELPPDEHGPSEGDVEPEAPEADAIEQRQPADPVVDDEAPGEIAAEVPEADALEQARALPVDEEPGSPDDDF